MGLVKIEHFHLTFRHLVRHAPYYVLAGLIIAIGLIALTNIWRQTPVASQTERVQDQIDAIDREIQAVRGEIERLEGVASQLRVAIENIRDQERELQLEINRSQLVKEKLDLQIAQTQERLLVHQQAFGNTIVDIYIADRVTPLELLASSRTVGDFIDRQEYRSALRGQLQVTINAIEAAKEELETKRNEVQETLAQLNSQKEQLETQRANQARLLRRTEGQEARYRELVATAQNERDAALQALDNLQIDDMPVQAEGAIEAGEGVGRVGSTGFSTGPHLHFEVRVNGQVVDPGPYLARDGWLQPAGDPVTQGFGNPSSWYTSGFHPGIDYAPPAGSPVRAAASGTLFRGCTSEVLNVPGNAYGYMAIIDHGGGITSVYGHMQAPEGAPCNSSYF